MSAVGTVFSGVQAFPQVKAGTYSITFIIFLIMGALTIFSAAVLAVSYLSARRADNKIVDKQPVAPPEGQPNDRLIPAAKELQLIEEVNKLRGQIDQLQESSLQRNELAELSISLHSKLPASFTLGIFNRSTKNLAHNVEVCIEEISGCLRFDNALPHHLRTQIDKQRRCDINPLREEEFSFVMATYGSVEDNKNVVFHIDGFKLDPRFYAAHEVSFRSGEYVHIKVKVYCANAEAQTALFFAAARPEGKWLNPVFYRLTLD